MAQSTHESPSPPPLQRRTHRTPIAILGGYRNVFGGVYREEFMFKEGEAQPRVRFRSPEKFPREIWEWVPRNGRRKSVSGRVENLFSAQQFDRGMEQELSSRIVQRIQQLRVRFINSKKTLTQWNTVTHCKFFQNKRLILCKPELSKDFPHGRT